MKRILALLAVLALLLPLAVAAQTTIDPTANRGIKPQRGLPNNPAIPGESMVTGLPVSAPYIPVLVNIDNVRGAWPQWGIADADIIYEMPIHGLSLTRLMALFAYNHPEAAGPVRSGRVLHAEMREEWDAAWAFIGRQLKEGSSVNEALRRFKTKDKPVNLIFDGGGNAASGLFRLMPGRGGPHNHSANVRAIAEKAGEYAFPARPFLFADALPTAGVPVVHVALKYGTEQSSFANSDFNYDPATNLYSRYRNNTVYEDKNNPGVPLTFSNLIVQWTDLKFNGAADAPLLTEVGEGNADIFTGGRYIAGYWVRESVTSRTVFYDQDGNEIRLQRGKTFINITTERSTRVSFE